MHTNCLYTIKRTNSRNIRHSEVILSVLIPSYNYDCRPLLQTLMPQMPEEAEIIVGDDYSTDAALVASVRDFCEANHVSYVRTDRNRGSAATRNLLCREAHGKWLLYIDCDTIVKDAYFIKKYLESREEGTVCCGTILHPETLPSPTQSLRWRYEKQMEKRFTAEQRNAHPYAHFRTSHFMIPHTLMLQNPFDESIRRSGYEDLLFGRRLEQNGIKVHHTDITALNGDIERNDIFLRKTEQQLHTLWQMREELAEYSTLLKCLQRIKGYHLTWALRLAYKLTRPILRCNLLGSHPSIKLFQFYKLGYYVEREGKRE